MDLWCFNIDELPDEDLNFHLKKLPTEQQDYILKFKWLKDRKHRLMARLMVRKYLLGNGIDPGIHLLRKDEKGCPYIENGPYISIAHSGRYVVLAIDAEQKIGLDIEEMKSIDFNLVSGNFHPDEISYLKQFNFESSHFYEVWTRKEALLKALGIGMMEGLDKICVLGNPTQIEKVWHFHSIEIGPDYYCSVSSGSNAPIKFTMLNYASF